MKIPVLNIAIIILIFLTNCKENVNTEISPPNNPKNELLLIPIHYDFDNLKLTLNSSISDSVSREFWKWDAMNSNNGVPDSTGIDYFMNLNQPVFSYNGEETLPALSIQTNKNKIIAFSATIIVQLTDTKTETIRNLLDNLTPFDLLKDEQIKQTIIDKRIFKNINVDFEESIELELSKEEYGYDRITYKINIH